LGVFLITDIRPPGKVAIVTGAAGGIGAAIAVALAQRGIASVLAVRHPDAAFAVSEGVRKLGIPCRVEHCDVSDYSTVKRCVSNTLAAWGRLDVVVNNAGQIDPQGPLAETSPAAWAQAVTTNMVGPYNVIHAALPELLRQHGAVVNISTGAAHTPRDGWSAYCSAKAGLYMLTRCVLNEYGKQGLSIYSLQPGLVDTAMQVRIRSEGVNEISRIARDRLAPPELSAGVVAWLSARMPQDLVGKDLSINDTALIERANAGG